jgi:hypothetical protein
VIAADERGVVVRARLQPVPPFDKTRGGSLFSARGR